MSYKAGVIMKVKNESDWLDVVKKTVEGIGFGVVTIVVHNAKVVQVDRTEKIRFESGSGGTNSVPLREPR
jgi:hypothetical protein